MVNYQVSNREKCWQLISAKATSKRKITKKKQMLMLKIQRFLNFVLSAQSELSVIEIGPKCFNVLLIFVNVHVENNSEWSSIFGFGARSIV